ncbi:hypothetical protein WMY93_033435 [Mugilogobius chulae]|uniref:Uncharacterized protein n=1 Tax=Mugilogobius chulae TaxID=88201 RepID=A0AAW0MTA9_9GOBI
MCLTSFGLQPKPTAAFTRKYFTFQSSTWTQPGLTGTFRTLSRTQRDCQDWSRTFRDPNRTQTRPRTQRSRTNMRLFVQSLIPVRVLSLDLILDPSLDPILDPTLDPILDSILDSRTAAG